MKRSLIAIAACLSLSAQGLIYSNETYEMTVSVPGTMKVVKTNPPMPDHGFKAIFPESDDYLWVNAEYAPADFSGIGDLLRERFKDVFGSDCSRVSRHGKWMIAEGAKGHQALAGIVRNSSRGEQVLYEIGLMAKGHGQSRGQAFVQVVDGLKFSAKPN